MEQGALVLAVAALVVGWARLVTVAARQVDARGRNGGIVGAALLLCFPIGILLWLRALRSQPSNIGEHRSKADV